MFDASCSAQLVWGFQEVAMVGLFERAKEFFRAGDAGHLA